MSRDAAPASGGPGAGPFEANASFLADYYEHVAAEDLQDYSPETLSRRARYHAQVAAARAPGQAAVGVLNENDASIVAVVADDMPHLVHSITAELTRENESIRLLVHPTFRVLREPRTHALVDIAHGPSRAGLTAANAGHAEIPDARPDDVEGLPSGQAETWVAVEIGRLAGKTAARSVIANLQRVLAEVRVVAEDSAAIHAKVADAVSSVDSFPGASDPPAEHLRELLLWLDSGNFIFLGYGEYDLTTAEGLDALRVRPGTGLGLLRTDRQEPDAQESGRPTPETPPDARARGPQALTLSTSDMRSSVPRPAYLDEIRAHIFNAAGVVTGERRFVGLFAPGATGQSVRRIPVIRDKVLAVQERLGFPQDSHQGKELLAALEAFPLDELFHVATDELARMASEILSLQQRRQTRLFLRADSIGRFMSALVFLPRRRYNTAVRLRIEQELRQTFKTPSIEFEARLSHSPMARVFFRILLGPGRPAPDVDPVELERRVVAASRSWTEGLDESLRDRFPADEAARLSTLWSGSFPPGYRADHDAEHAVRDIVAFEAFDLDGTGGRALDDPLLTVYVRPEAIRPLAENARMRLYLTKAQSLTQFLPFLHNLGLEVLDQRPFELRRGSGHELFLYDLGLKYPPGIGPLETSMLLAESFCAAMRGDIESDGFDALVIREGISWRQVVILRSYAKYLQQLGTMNSYGFMADTLLSNTRATHALLALFQAKFVPGKDWTQRIRNTAAARKELIAAIEEIPSLDADRLLRTFLNLVEATLRTNYFQERPHVSFKLSPAAIPNAPFPRPKFEIWVYSPRVEGVHLRFGMLARGGLRWSDRSEDFRTEILGLVKAQNVKNSVIVPTGAKGGFYPKQLPDPAADRETWLAEGLECYRIFIRGLLDVTDNLLSSGSGDTVVVPPERVVRHDGDDYYLVVAADKGTAAFSDIANEVAHEYGFWLDDAFASGGSVGYDHKKIGITARGVWESVKQHFRELGLDTQQEDFTVVGIGDMSGDVFGNGMLLSRHILLIAAFDHRHIFLDPNPDPGASYAERQRLFRLPRSSWADYDPRLISEGGGVYARAAKTIPVSGPVRASLSLDKGRTSMAPQELLQAILRAPVDLIYNGGIGTYIKASAETHADVGDKANDGIRVNGNELRVRVIAEGGNLGVTQRGRIEAALHGVILNTDAIDNSAGVDCSDHEVNIKILIDTMIAAGLMHREERTEFLHSLTDEVARLVLKDNTEQNTLLVAERQLVLNWSPGFERTMDWLEAGTDLDRNLEGLPSTAALHARLERGEGLTSPELSVLAAYAKIELARELNASDLADDPWFHQALRSYFPRQIVERFGAELDRHPLRREIVGTVVANDIVNIGGITFAFRAMEETTASAAAVARAFVVLREAYDLDSIVAALAALPPGFPSVESAGVALHMRRLLDRATRWYVTHDHRDQPVAEALARIKPTLDVLRTKTSHYLRGADLDLVQDRLAHWDSVGLPPEIGKRASDLLESFALLDISLISEQVREPVTAIIDVHYAIFERIGVVRLLLRITDLPRANRWEALARAALRDDVYSALADMTTSVMQSTRTTHAPGVDAVERIVAWERGHQEQLARIKDTFADVTKPGDVDIASISVALKLLRTLVRR